MLLHVFNKDKLLDNTFNMSLNKDILDTFLMGS